MIFNWCISSVLAHCFVGATKQVVDLASVNLPGCSAGSHWNRKPTSLGLHCLSAHRPLKTASRSKLLARTFRARSFIFHLFVMQNPLDSIGHGRSASCTTPHSTADLDLSQLQSKNILDVWATNDFGFRVSIKIFWNRNEGARVSRGCRCECVGKGKEHASRLIQPRTMQNILHFTALISIS
jgi:hypothetical protein